MASSPLLILEKIFLFQNSTRIAIQNAFQIMTQCIQILTIATILSYHVIHQLNLLFIEVFDISMKFLPLRLGKSSGMAQHMSKPCFCYRQGPVMMFKASCPSYITPW